MRDSGVELVAVSAEPQEFVEEMIQKHSLGFKVSQFPATRAFLGRPKIIEPFGVGSIIDIL